MTRHRVLSAIVLTAASVLSGSVARAAEHAPPFPRLFAPAKGSPSVEWAIRRVDRACGFSEMERAGPTPAEERRCSSAESELVAHGPKALGAVLASLDRDDLGPGARPRLYDAVAKLEDRSAVAILVSALERLAAPGAEERTWEVEYIELALQQLTFAKVGQVLPWEPGDSREPALAAREWKAWLSRQPNLDAERLLTERLDADRPHLGDADFWRAFWYASFFSEHPVSREEGVAALQRLLARAAAADEEKSAVKEKLHEAERELRRQRARAPRVTAPVSPATSSGTPGV